MLPRLPPALNASPAAVMRMARAAGISMACVSAASSASIISGPSGLRASGWFSSIWKTAPRDTQRTGASGGTGGGGMGGVDGGGGGRMARLGVVQFDLEDGAARHAAHGGIVGDGGGCCVHGVLRKRREWRIQCVSAARAWAWAWAWAWLSDRARPPTSVRRCVRHRSTVREESLACVRRAVVRAELGAWHRCRAGPCRARAAATDRRAAPSAAAGRGGGPAHPPAGWGGGGGGGVWGGGGEGTDRRAAPSAAAGRGGAPAHRRAVAWRVALRLPTRCAPGRRQPIANSFACAERPSMPHRSRPQPPPHP